MKDPIIAAISNPVRLQLLCCLSKKSRRNVSELMQNCGLAQSAVSQHLSKLKKAGLVSAQKDGRLIYYSLTNPKTGQIANLLREYIKPENTQERRA